MDKTQTQTIAQTYKITVKDDGFPGHRNWYWPDGRVRAHNVPRDESPQLPAGFQWVGIRTVRANGGAS